MDGLEMPHVSVINYLQTKVSCRGSKRKEFRTFDRLSFVRSVVIHAAHMFPHL